MIREHLDNSRLVESIKDQISKEDGISIKDKNIVLEKLKSDGVLTHILGEIQKKRSGKGKNIIGGYEISKSEGRYIENKEYLDPLKRYMIAKVYRGSGFVDYIEPKPDEFLKLSVSFLNQRYSSSLVTSTSEPVFDLTIHFEIPSSFDSHTMLKEYSPIVLILQKQRANENAVILSTAIVDWRELLCHNSVDINIEMKPVSRLLKGSIGIIHLELDFEPVFAKSDLLSALLVKNQQDTESKLEAEGNKKFLEYAKDWDMEYRAIRKSHKDRLVKIYVETDDRNTPYRASCSLIYPMIADRMLDSPYHACRFVSLLPFQRLEDYDKDRVEIWSSMQAFLTRGCGDSEEHAVLLCNLLLGFGLEAYVCVGTNSEGAHAWTMTIDSSSDISKSKAVFWECLTGQRFELSDPRIHRFYRTIGCVFNNKAFYANIQADDRVISTIFDLEDDSLWKAMKPKMIEELKTVPYASIMPSCIDVYTEQKILEKELKDQIVAYRNSEGKITAWDSQLGYLLNQALVSYELQRLSGQKFSEDEFKSSIQNYVPTGYTFKAFPIQFNHYDPNKMVITISKSKVGYEVLSVSEAGVKHSVCAKIIPYPENISAVWVMVACYYNEL